MKTIYYTNYRGEKRSLPGVQTYDIYPTMDFMKDKEGYFIDSIRPLKRKTVNHCVSFATNIYEKMVTK